MQSQETRKTPRGQDIGKSPTQLRISLRKPRKPRARSIGGYWLKGCLCFVLILIKIFHHEFFNLLCISKGRVRRIIGYFSTPLPRLSLLLLTCACPNGSWESSSNLTRLREEVLSTNLWWNFPNGLNVEFEFYSPYGNFTLKGSRDGKVVAWQRRHIVSRLSKQLCWNWDMRSVD